MQRKKYFGNRSTKLKSFTSHLQHSSRNSHQLSSSSASFPAYLVDEQDKSAFKHPVTPKKGKNISLSLPKTSRGLEVLVEDGMLGCTEIFYTS